MRELSAIECDEVSGGPGPLVWVAVVAAGAVIGDAVVNVVEGASDGFTDGDTCVGDNCVESQGPGGGGW